DIFSTQVVNALVGTTSYTTAALPDGTYYWRVTAIDSQGDAGKRSSVWHYTIDTIAPDQTDLMFPGNSSGINDVTPRFEWWSATGADLYQLQIDDNLDFSSTIENITTSNTEYTLIVPLADDTYYWRVRGYDNAGNLGLWSESWFFNLDSVGPNPPVLIQPLNDTYTSDTTPTFQTDITADAIEWNYQVIYTDSILIDISLASNGWTIGSGSPLSEGRYHWRVRAKDSLDNWSTWSTNWTFTVDTTNPLLNNPPGVDMIEGATGVNISWDITELNLYTYEVYFEGVAVDSGLLTLTGDTLSVSLDGLPVGTYNYTILVTDSAGNIAVDTVFVTVTAVVPEFNPFAIILAPILVLGTCIVYISKRRK
ncbi:MAG: Ig-like domain-containing protein, partial [Candidatus Heimdallarchaeaceae archaeon]